MKHIRQYNESENSSRQDITKEDKDYFDIIFADFIDAGAKSSLFESDISYSSPGGHASVYRKNVRYRIDINLDEQYANENKRLGGVYPVTNSRNGNVKDLINYSQYMIDHTLEIGSCIEKIKIEYPYISNFVKSFGANDGPFKMTLLIYHL